MFVFLKVEVSTLPLTMYIVLCICSPYNYEWESVHCQTSKSKRSDLEDRSSLFTLGLYSKEFIVRDAVDEVFHANGNI